MKFKCTINYCYYFHEKKILNQCTQQISISFLNQWFLSNGNGESYDDVQSTYVLKHRADYFYAQCEYGEALNCYKELLQSIPRTNTMLCHEINESMTLCLQKMNENLEAMDVIQKMVLYLIFFINVVLVTKVT